MDMQPNDQQWMKKALQLAQEAAQIGEVPVGAVVVFEDQIVGSGFNRREIDHDPLAHAELLAIQEASRNLGRWRLTGCTLYVTLEPCTMCAGALVNARLDRLVYGAKDPKAGGIGSLYEIASDPRLNHRLDITSGVLENECSKILKSFFGKLRIK
ncbi:MAG: tRNA adenosine(34) deaminase TadA [Deltaproteobacteria bacterium]|nr:tRNA adenosine(34) deaminase TadA [Deltaproteobacteria bacterium]